jgi:Arc/MetJ-type ribon-helix-helix transcriptional regulator
MRRRIEHQFPMTGLSLETRRLIEGLVESGRFPSPEAVISEAIRRLRDDFDSNGRLPMEELTAEEWCERFETWAASHRPLPREADDSRDAIYAGRGE